MAKAAHLWRIYPREISFKGTVQLLNAFREKGLLNKAKSSEEIYEVLFKAIVRHRVGNRLGRLEPHVIKRRSKEHQLMTKPRNILRKALKGYSLN